MSYEQNLLNKYLMNSKLTIRTLRASSRSKRDVEFTDTFKFSIDISSHILVIKWWKICFCRPESSDRVKIPLVIEGIYYLLMHDTRKRLKAIISDFPFLYIFFQTFFIDSIFLFQWAYNLSNMIHKRKIVINSWFNRCLPRKVKSTRTHW